MKCNCKDLAVSHAIQKKMSFREKVPNGKER